MDKKSLQNRITKIIVLSHYEIETKGFRGDTAEAISNFEKRAIDKYQGKSNMPLEINSTSAIFHARVNRDVALIMRAIEESENPSESRSETPK